MTFPIIPASTVSGSYQISRSLRFRSSASAYLSRTFGTPTNNKIWTWSAWVKRGALSTLSNLFRAPSTSPTTGIRFEANDTLRFFFSDATAGDIQTTQVFRDPSAWYHIVVVVDTTQATAANRVKLYVNGSQITALSTATYPTQNYNTQINSAITHTIGYGVTTGTELFDGYLAEVNFIDGSALTPSSFGAFDTNGVWQPIACTVSDYGKNGFYLPFSDSANIFNDKAAIATNHSAANNWTNNNLQVATSTATTYDYMIDSPTNYADGGNGRGNYAVLNPLWVNTSTLSNGNLNCVTNNAATKVLATFGMSSGKWYWEYSYTDLTGDGLSGIATNASSSTTLVGNDAFSWAYFASTGNKRTNSTSTAYGNTYAVNDVIAVAFDADNGALYFGKISGGVITWQNSGVPTSGASATGAAFTSLTSGPYFPAFGDANSAASSTLWVNFGQQPFLATPPSGFSALNTQNLPTPTIAAGNKYFDINLRGGTGAPFNVTGKSVAPDFVWTKERGTADGHRLFSRGLSFIYTYIDTSSTGAEVNNSNNLTAFNADGFSGGSGLGTTGFNDSGATYVDWMWKAGGTGVTNTSGSITSTVSANTSAGFSVVTYTGDGNLGGTVGHGLGVAPALIIVKERTAAGNWPVYHSSIGKDGLLILNLTNGTTSSTNYWGTGGVTSTVFGTSTTAGASNGTNRPIVAYCFAPVAGYSAFGSYTGNGSADGPFVYCGFRPRYLLVKSSSSVTSWIVMDTSRSPYNATNVWLSPDQSAAENNTTEFYDFLSNGFKLRYAGANNASGQTFIYAAFAENPFRIARAR